MNGACRAGRWKGEVAWKQKVEGLGRGRCYGRSDSSSLQPVGNGQIQQPLAPPAVRQCLTARPCQPSHASHVGKARAESAQSGPLQPQ